MEPARIESVGVRELRQHASRYIDRAAGGERLAVSKRGQVVAYLVPASSGEQTQVDSLIAKGVVAPPSDPTGQAADVATVSPPANATSASEALIELREDERW